ncbi:hypothetical protein OHD26_10790 [Escherichia coli]|nr:hypothetical protein [Escherichia coli]
MAATAYLHALIDRLDDILMMFSKELGRVTHRSGCAHRVAQNSQRQGIEPVLAGKLARKVHCGPGQPIWRTGLLPVGLGISRY